MTLQSTIDLARKYLLSLGVSNTFLKKNLNTNIFSDSLILTLPDVCVVKQNRLHGGSSNQVHIHVTGDDMLVFYDEQILSKVQNSTEDEELQIYLINSNLEHLKTIKQARRNAIYEPVFKKTGIESLLNTTTVKKISKRSRQAAQVQISKVRRDGILFSNLRQYLFTEDRLIFLKYNNSENCYMVIGIPSTFNDSNTQSLVREDNLNYDVEVKQIDDVELRSVDINTIATYKTQDEDDDISNLMFDLSKGIKMRKKRTERHSDIVKLVATSLQKRGFTLYEGRIDCLGIRNSIKTPAVISEIKTLNGTVSDENNQVMKAFSQLFYYEEFHMGQFKDMCSQKIVVFENKISDDHINFFEKNDILVFWVQNNSLVGTDSALKFLYGLNITR